MKVKSRKEKQMEVEIMKINIGYILENGKMTKEMEWARKNSKQKEKNILVISSTINMKVKENS